MSENNYVEANGLKIFYLEKGKGYPLILLHGGISVGEDNWGNKSISLLSILEL